MVYIHCTYGLEVLTLTKKDIEMLEKFQRKSLKQIQSLPDEEFYFSSSEFRVRKASFE